MNYFSQQHHSHHMPELTSLFSYKCALKLFLNPIYHILLTYLSHTHVPNNSSHPSRKKSADVVVAAPQQHLALSPRHYLPVPFISLLPPNTHARTQWRERAQPSKAAECAPMNEAERASSTGCATSSRASPRYARRPLAWLQAAAAAAAAPSSEPVLGSFRGGGDGYEGGIVLCIRCARRVRRGGGGGKSIGLVMVFFFFFNIRLLHFWSFFGWIILGLLAEWMEF